MFRLFYIFIFLGFLGNADSEEPESIDQFIIQSSELLEMQRGILYLKGQPMEGMVQDFYDILQNEIKSETTYKRGLKDGMVYKYHPNGNLAEKRLYKNGKKVGIHYGWWENGNAKFELRFNGNGNYQGECLEWFDDGSQFKSFNYVDGHEFGHQKMWNPDGSLRANYIIKNNRKYGLQGRKKCISTDSFDLSVDLDF